MVHFDPDRVSTVTFDSYSTLVDVESVERVLDDHVDDTRLASTVWRSRSLMYTMVANDTDAYQPFYECNRDALTFTLESFGVDVTDEVRDDILSVYHELDVFPDVRASVEALRDAGYPCYVVSNGNPEMLDSMVEGADIGDLLTGVVSADEVETFKPDAEIYRHAAARTGTPVDEIAHATAGWFDVQGAQHAGMQGVWVNRKADPQEPFGPTPDLTVDGLGGLVERLV